MIDTIVLSLSANEYSTNNRYRLQSIDAQIQRGASFIKTTINPTKKAQMNNYVPRIALYKKRSDGGWISNLRIEFSTPKLLYGNNVEEVSELNFDNIINILAEKLGSVGINVVPEVIKESNVVAVHYSKNIFLENNLITYSVLKELKKGHYKQTFDVTEIEYRNGGHSLKIRTNNFEIILYDKIRDYQRSIISEKRAVGNDNYLETELLEAIMKKKSEILRIEVRLNSLKEIKNTLKTCEIATNTFTFNSLFSETTSKTILLHYWELIVKGYQYVQYNQNTTEENFIHLIATGRRKVTKNLQILALKTLLSEIGSRGLQSILKHYNRNNWYRLFAEVKNYPFPISQESFISEIRTALTEFEAINLTTNGEII